MADLKLTEDQEALERLVQVAVDFTIARADIWGDGQAAGERNAIRLFSELTRALEMEGMTVAEAMREGSNRLSDLELAPGMENHAARVLRAVTEGEG